MKKTENYLRFPSVLEELQLRITIDRGVPHHENNKLQIFDCNYCKQFLNQNSVFKTTHRKVVTPCVLLVRK